MLHSSAFVSVSKGTPRLLFPLRHAYGPAQCHLAAFFHIQGQFCSWCMCGTYIHQQRLRVLRYCWLGYLALEESLRACREERPEVALAARHFRSRFRIFTEECLTFRTVSSERVDVVRFKLYLSHVRIRLYTYIVDLASTDLCEISDISKPW